MSNLIKDVCRVCLSEGLMQNIFRRKNSWMISKLMTLTKVSIHPDDGLPKTICRKCVKKLNQCVQFLQLCIDSDLKLRTLAVEFESPSSILDTELQNDLNQFSNSDTEKDLLIDHTDSCYLNDDVVNNKPDKLENDFPINESRKKTVKQQCFTCGKVMSSRFRLKTHLRTHTGERPFPCTHCNRSFSLAQSLKVHLRTHTGEKPLKCSECDATFAHSAGLAAHKRKHSGQTPYQCLLCPRSFRTIGHLQYHMRRHTGEKNYDCKTCHRAFITRSELKQHLISHTGDKPHVCCICGLRLTRASHLKRHMQFIHKEDKQQDCAQCPLKFPLIKDLEEHRRKNEAESTE